MEAQQVRDRRRRRQAIIGAGLLALIAAVATYVVLSRPTAEEVPTESVVVALRDVGARTEITADDVGVQEIPATARLGQAFTDPEVVIGQVTGVPIYAGQQITPNLFAGALEDPLGIVPVGEEITDDSPLWRAFSISVPSERAVGGQLQTGDQVDLIVSLLISVDTILVPSFDEEGNLVLIPQDASEIGFVSPETGEIEGIRSGLTSKVTLTDLIILNADVEAGVYVVRVDLAQAEILTQIMRDPQVGPTALDPFTFALRARADTRTVDTDALGTTLDRIIEAFGFRVPFLLDLDALLGFDVDPIVPEQPESPEDEPEPEPEPEPES